MEYRRDGLAFTRKDKKVGEDPRILKRIDLLVRMDTRFKQHFLSKNLKALEELAAEYESLGALNQASRIRFKAQHL